MHIFAASYLLPISGSPVAGGAVAVDKGKIAAVGKLDDLRKQFAAPLSEFPGAVLMPGLVNAHTHLELTNFPFWLRDSGCKGSCSSFVDWIKTVISVKRGIGFEALSASLTSGLQLSLQSGTTMVGDILSDRRLTSQYSNSALSGRVYFEFLGQNPERYMPLLATLDNDIAGLPRNYLPGISPHAPFTVSGHLLTCLLQHARQKSLPLTMHLAESAEESIFFQDAAGKIASELYPFVAWEDYLPETKGNSATYWLDSLGVLGEDFLAVHGVHLDRFDLGKLQNSGASLVLAPRSNDTLGVGKAPVEMMIKSGIPLALGTDSLASSRSLSLWDEMRFLLDAFPKLFSPLEAITMATIGGARAIKRDHEAGSLVPGKRADFIVVETGEMPEYSRLGEQLLDHATVCGVWCGGEKAWGLKSD